MESMHTPGPWYGKNSGDQGLICQEETGKSIAVTYDTRDRALVAAAPEMYEALKEVVGDYKHLAFPEDDETVNQWRSNILNKLLSAIAKAEGR